MKFNVLTEMEYSAASAGTLILNIHALRSPKQTVISEEFVIDPYIKVEELVTPGNSNRVFRFEVKENSCIKVKYKATVDNYYELKDYSNIVETPIARIDNSILPYLYPSRYCQSDLLYNMASNLFSYIENPFQKVLALTNWINQNVQYLSGSTNSETSAFDTLNQRQGVCRDFAHLGIAFCRALTIPARYFTGYAYELKPADFHACFEAYLGNEWVLFDATGLVPLNGLIKIASGRDAADTAIANIFGNVMFTSMVVSCELTDNGFIPYYYNPSKPEGLSYL